MNQSKTHLGQDFMLDGQEVSLNVIISSQAFRPLVIMVHAHMGCQPKADFGQDLRILVICRPILIQNNYFPLKFRHMASSNSS